MANKTLDDYLTGLADNASVVADDDTLFVHNTALDTIRQLKVSDLVGGWRDLRAPLLGGKTAGVNDPSLKQFGASGHMRQFSFDVNDEVFVAFHIDHDIKVGSTVYPHVHWSTDGTSTITVKWHIGYMIAARNDTTHETFPVPTELDVIGTPQGSAWEHIVTEHGAGFPAPEVDSLVLIHLQRVTNGGTNNPDEVFGLFLDLHYEAQQYGTPSRSPAYYA